MTVRFLLLMLFGLAAALTCKRLASPGFAPSDAWRIEAIASAADEPALPSDARLREMLRAKLGHQQEANYREIRRVGDKTIVLENFIAGDMDFKQAPEILSDFPRWKQWVLPGINEKPSGGKYIAQLNDLEFSPPELMLVTFSFELPLFRGSRTAKFKVTARQEPGVFTLSGETADSQGTFSHARAIMKVFPSPHPGHSWMYVNGRAKLKSWILYEALPEKLLRREAGDRVRILLDNYLKEETARRAGARARPAAKTRGPQAPEGPRGSRGSSAETP